VVLNLVISQLFNIRVSITDSLNQKIYLEIYNNNINVFAKFINIYTTICWAAHARKNGMFSPFNLSMIPVYTHLFIIVVKSRETLSQESVNPGLEAKQRNTKPKS
jgi:hypothetical protein